MYILIISGLFLVSLLFRAYGFFADYPFWVDEFSTAVQSQYVLRYGLTVFSNSSVYFEHHNVLTHFLTAFLFQILGSHEWVARLPSLFFGSLIPVLVFIVAGYFFDKKTGIIAAVLTALSYFEIVWSRQARSYTTLQFAILTTVFFYFRFIDGKKRSNLFLFLVSLVFGLLTHSFFYILIGTLTIHSAVSIRRTFPSLITSLWFYVFAGLTILVLFFLGLPQTMVTYFLRGGFFGNNFWYYHSFLWREYGLFVFLAVIGLLAAFSRKNRFVLFSLLYFLAHLTFITFVFRPLATRYLLPVFPIILLFVAYCLSSLPGIIFQNRKNFLVGVTPYLLTLFILANGHKMVNRPRKFYSVNHDFREVALIDYRQVYDLIKMKNDQTNGKAAVVETWPARIYWYLGMGYQPSYMFKWKGQTPYRTDKKGQKVIRQTRDLKLIENLEDLKKVMETYKEGFIFIDDTSLPGDVIDYAQKNLKKELYLDHYTLDDNPYSIWPATLYSWGIKS